MRTEQIGTIGRRLAHIRAALGYSQRQMAAELGVAPRTYAYYERDQRDPGTDVLLLLAKLGWSPFWVLSGAGAELLSPREVDTVMIAVGDPDDAEVQAAERRRTQAIKDFSAGVRASQLAGPDLDTLEAAVRVVRGALERTRTTTDDAGFSELVRVIYEMLVHGAELDSASRVVSGLLAALADAKPSATTTKE